MKEITRYYPRKPFWAFWKKRQVEYTRSISDTEMISQSFTPQGYPEYMKICKKNGDREYIFYHQNGQMKCRTIDNKREHSFIKWDESGKVLENYKFYNDTEIETHFHPNGKIKIQYNHSTGAYEEFFMDGKLKRKGLWLRQDGTVPFSFTACGSRFETGNMRSKLQDQERQDYNYAIGAINELPPSVGRKIAKEALLKTFKDSCSSR